MMPVAKIFQINNGFLLSFEDADVDGVRNDMTYAADAKGLAEAIIAAAARKKLGIEKPAPEQTEMFTSAQMGDTQRSQ